MASYNELNALIDAYINRNGVQAITGQILNGVLKAMVEQLGRGYTIMGAATPTTDPGTPDAPECWFASEAGTYTDFDGLQIVPGELALLCYTPSDGWTKATIYEGFQEVQATIDGNVGTPSVGVSYADGVLSFDFRNMKGNPGDAAGFGTIGADIAGGVGTPGVSVESSGPATAKNLQFHFTNLKGETGVTSVVATVDNTVGTPTCTVSLVGQQLTLAFSGLKGAQGNTGSSVDYPFTIVNNLTTDDATQALSAAQGVVLDGKISQLQQETDELDLQVNGGLESIPYNNPGTGYFIDLSVGIGNEVSLTPLYFASIPWKYAVKEVSTNVSVIVNGEGGASGRLWGFLDADNKLLSVADANVSATGLELSVPNGAVKVVINNKSGQVSYIKDANSRITRNGKAIEETNISLFGRNSANLNIENTGYVIRTGNYGSTAWTVPLAQTNFGYAKVNCSEGDLFFVSAYGETYARAYAFCKSDNSVIESSPADTGVSKLIVAPKNASYIVVNNDFVQNSTPVAIKVSEASLSQLFKEDSRINAHINNNIEVPVFGPNATEIAIAITNYYLKTYGVGSTADTTPTSGTNFGYVKQNCVAGDVFLVYSKGGNTGLAYAFCSAEDIVLASSSPQEIVSGLVIAPEGTSYIVVNNYFVTIANPILYKLTDGALCSLKREISGAVTGETEKIKATNIGGFYLKNNKIVLSGASISEPRNGYFEYAMQELGISCLNTSVASTNIYKLANLLYSSPDDFTDFDVLIMSHIHNYDVFTLPSGKNEFTATDYENDATIGPYIKTSSYYTGYLQAAGGYTADELYAMGFDYVLKKWATLCYALRNTAGYDSVFGKPFQVILYTYWHDARTIYNASVRQLAKKWGISLIKDDENIGFSKKQVNPATGGQWSVLYGDTTGYVPTEVIDGVTYGVHPCRMTSADYTAWQQSGVLNKDYLPFIQKVRANILIHTLKDAIMK